MPPCTFSERRAQSVKETSIGHNFTFKIKIYIKITGRVAVLRTSVISVTCLFTIKWHPCLDKLLFAGVKTHVPQNNQCCQLSGFLSSDIVFT